MGYDPENARGKERNDRWEHSAMGEKNAAVYRGSNGTWYTRWEVDHLLRRGRWRRCLDEREEGVWFFEQTDGDGLLALVAGDLETLPDWLEVRSDGRRARVVDTRRGPPIDVKRPPM